MRMGLAIGVLLLLGTSGGFAQPAAQTQGPSNPQEQIERTIGNLFIANTNLNAQLQVIQAELAKAQARIKELEGK